ncbi:MAG TPA: prephenate dehydratase domain-containing protein [Ruminiclostridium sp.]|nr:prephenate dehydratase domain-containing protein [Ruminiclostridium sp.]
MTLEDARKEIDNIDSQLFELFLKRMNISDDIARIKMHEGVSILNSAREQKVLKKVESFSPEDYAQYSAALASFIMELSRNRQRDILLNEGSLNYDFLNEINDPQEETNSPRVAVQGVAGCFAGKAASKLYPDGTLQFVDKWDDVLYSLQDGSADYGILPVENSTAGSVIDVYDLLLKYKCYIVKGLQLPVTHSLLGVRGASVSDIKSVYSHPHAFPQCQSFFKEHCRFNKIPYFNTAMAAQMVAKAGDKSKAAIASGECAHIYGLDVLADSIQDSDLNCTRFIAVSKNLELHENANKISLVFSLPHITGSLYRTLSRFSLNGLNLTKIESRPDPKTPFEYYFYVDFVGNTKAPKTANLLGALNEELPFFNFLGNYHE